MSPDAASGEVHGEGAVGALADRLFRHESARLRGALVRILGAGRLDLADDIVQDALLTALRHWRFRGVPENPAAWLTRVAQRKALDVVRRDLRHAHAERELAAWASSRDAWSPADPESRDDPIRLMLMCCHPALSERDRVLLTLSLAAGFGAPELARAFLISSEAAEQRLVRARRALRESGDSIDEIERRASSADGGDERVIAVLDTVYLMLNEGYGAHAGDQLMRRELIDESRRLLGMLLDSRLIPEGSKPAAHALSALACLLAARAEARTDSLGGLVLMEDQDRSRWDRGLIAQGFWHLSRSSRADTLSAYGVEAAIAACHAAAPTYAQTDWAQIASLYELLHRVKPTPIVLLNRAVAISMRDGAAAGLAALDAVLVGGLSDRYHLVEATRGGMLARVGRHEAAAASFRRALSLPCSEPERAFLREKLAATESTPSRASLS